MKALVHDDYCGLDGMRLDEMPDPVPGPDDVLIEVHAAGINPIDWKVRAGLLRARFELDFPDIPGRDVSGVVVATGENVSDLKKGDAVFGVCPPNRHGSHAELVAADAAIFAMAVVNITGLYFLMPIVRKELGSYMERLKSGEIRRFKH